MLSTLGLLRRCLTRNTTSSGFVEDALFFTNHQIGLDNVHYVRLSHAKLVKSLDSSEKQINEFENEKDEKNERKEILGGIEFYSSNNGTVINMVFASVSVYFFFFFMNIIMPFR